MQPCPSDFDWSRWFARELADDRRALLLAHLDGCEDCRAVCAALTPAETSALVGGGERYVLGDQVTRGGMGRILRARDRVLGRDVVLKVPHVQAGAQERFAREIAILATLSHPSIVTVLDAGRLDADTPFFAMPFLAGRTLAAEVAAGRGGRQALLAIVPALSAMAYAHALGVVHRDLKPENLFIGPFGECTVLDWGLAVVLGTDAPYAGGGSEGYASPEQRAGLPPTPDHDVYALGALLRFVMTGAIPAELRSIIERAMAPSGTRYATATELMADVQRYLARGRVVAHAYSVRERAAAWLRRHRTTAAALATAIAVAGGVGAWSVWRIVGERDRAVAAERDERAARERGRALTTFLLEQVHESIAELGRLDLAANLIEGLEQHVASAPDDGGAEAVQQIELRILMADIAVATGSHDDALRHLAPVEASLARLPPIAALTAHLRCEAARRTADAHRGKGEPAAAQAALTACLDHMARVPRASGPRFDSTRTWAAAHVALGDLQRDEGDRTAALASYRAAGIVLATAGAPATDADIAAERLVMHAAVEQRIGSLAELQYQYAEAEPHLRAALAHAEAAVAMREHEASAQWLVAQVQVALATTLGERGALAEKRALIAKAARIAEPLFAIDPTNDKHARWMTVLWRAQAETGPAAAAPALFERMLEVSRRRAQLQPRSTAVLRDLGVDLVTTASWLAEHADTADAHRHALRICDEAIEVMQRALPAAADVALTLVHCAEIAAALDDRPLAQRHRRAAIEQTRAAATRSDPAMLAAYATALATYLTDATAAERRDGWREMDRVWRELRAAGADELMASTRELAPWWQPKEK